VHSLGIMHDFALQKVNRACMVEYCGVSGFSQGRPLLAAGCG